MIDDPLCDKETKETESADRSEMLNGRMYSKRHEAALAAENRPTEPRTPAKYTWYLTFILTDPVLTPFSRSRLVIYINSHLTLVPFIEIISSDLAGGLPKDARICIH